MKTIRMGSLSIEDKNNNDFFEPKIDQIKNERGEAIQPDSPEVRKVLDGLGLPSLQGFSLWNASIFSAVWETAKRNARLGQPRRVEYDLQRARDYYEATHLPFDEKRASDLMASAYMAAAEGLAGGHLWISDEPIENVKMLLTSAETFAMDGNEGFDVAKAEKILNSSLSEYIEAAFQDVEEDILRGEEKNIPSRLEKILQYSKEGNIPVDPKKIRFLENYGSWNDEMKRLARKYFGAKKLAEKLYSPDGDLPSTVFLLNQADRAALELERRFGVEMEFHSAGELKAIMNNAHKRLVEFAFEGAEWASAFEDLERSLQYVMEKCQELNMPFDRHRAKVIVRQLHERILESYYRAAEEAALKLDVFRCWGFLGRGVGYARKYDLPFDEDLAERIERVLPLKYYRTQVEKDTLLRSLGREGLNPEEINKALRRVYAFDVERAKRRKEPIPTYDKDYMLSVRFEALQLWDPLFTSPLPNGDSLESKQYEFIASEAKKEGRLVPSYEEWLSLKGEK